jgi:lipopolysaccharide heptosyltransferase II
MKAKTMARIVSFFVFLIDKTLRKKYLNETQIFPTQAIYPFWHGDEFAMLLNNQNKDICIMVSLSKDGEVLAETLEIFGYRTVRGSSNKGAQRALIEIIREARKGYNVAFAADGPKGPYHKLKEGVVYCAQKTGLPIVCITSSAKNRLILKKSWEKGRIPLPFSKVIQLWVDPIFIKDGDDILEKTVLVENKLNNLFEFCDKYYWQKDISKYLQYHPCPKILIVQPSRIGDIIFTLPSLISIKKKYPHSEISWIVDERCAQILEGNPYLKDIFIWDRKNKSLSYYKELKEKLRKKHFDLSIDFHGLAKSAMLVMLAGAKFKIASSSTNGMREFSWLISKQIKNPDPKAHCIERHLAVAKYLNCDEIFQYPIDICGEDKERVVEKLTREGVDINNIIAVHPGGGWLSRRWPSKKFAELCQKITKELKADIVLIGGKEGGSGEKGLSDEIISLALGAKIFDMTGNFTLKELCAFFKMCKVFVGNEAGPMHIAAVLGVSCIAILGPTDAKRTGPYKGDVVIIQKYVPCQPCRNRNCKNPICMKEINVDEVFEALCKKFRNSQVL